MNEGVNQDSSHKWLQWLSIGQGLKWCIYGVLAINFLFYVFEEADQAMLLLDAESDWLAWSAAFKTTIDELGWLGLLLAFELETYWLANRSEAKRRVNVWLAGFRGVCYVLLAHTILTNVNSAREYLALPAQPIAQDLCELTDTDSFYRFNLDYQSITEDNCAALNPSEPNYRVEPGVLTSEKGFAVAGWHTWIDLQDAIAWIIVVLAIELSVRLKNLGITKGRFLMLAQVARLGYGVLVLDGVFWLVMGHYLYAFDQAVWIGGFWAIEHNLKMRRSTLDR
ncbi:MAG: hypothetical protein O2858_04510 [Proteobacteria bacterium]|nr:hypothetical protein [Pseudomonadota bacterium]